MKSRSRHFGDRAFGAELTSGDDSDWPAVVRRLAVKVQPGPYAAPRKNKLSRRNDDEPRTRRIVRVKPEGVPH